MSNLPKPAEVPVWFLDIRNLLGLFGALLLLANGVRCLLAYEPPRKPDLQPDRWVECNRSCQVGHIGVRLITVRDRETEQEFVIAQYGGTGLAIAPIPKPAEKP